MDVVVRCLKCGYCENDSREDSRLDPLHNGVDTRHSTTILRSWFDAHGAQASLEKHSKEAGSIRAV